MKLVSIIYDFILGVYWCLLGAKLTLQDLGMRERLHHWWSQTPHLEEVLAEKALIDTPSKKGYTCIITGSNSGVGLETARHIATTGYRVIMACRSKEKAEEAIKDIIKTNKAKNKPHDIVFMPLDLASQKSVRDFVGLIKKEENLKLDLLINNAGLMWVPKGKTKDGVELHFGVNYLGHFLLTNELLPLMQEPGRIVSLTSETYRLGKIPVDDLDYSKYYSPFYAYCNSKLACLHFAYSLADKIKKSGKKIGVFSVNPGTAKTNIIQELPVALQFLYSYVVPKFLLRTPYQAACCSIFAALSADLEGKTGLYLFESQVKNPDSNTHFSNLTERNILWTISENLTNSKFPF